MHIPANHTITTDRIILKRVDEADIPHVFEATRHAGFNDGMGWDAPEHPDELRAHLARAHAAWDEGDYSFSMWLRDIPNTLVGRISIRSNDWGDGYNIGYWTHPVHQRKGYMTEALNAVLKFGFEQLEVPWIEAYYAVWNTGSGRVLEKVGMRLKSFVRQGFKKGDVWVPEYRVLIRKEEWNMIQDARL